MDDFYTPYETIEAELCHYYLNFKNKTVYCNCDDFFMSEFVRYFLDNFEFLGLKRLIVTNYNNSALPENNAYCVSIAEVRGGLDCDTLLSLPGNTIRVLEGDGDFRSAECVGLLDEADVLVTNPPFSLFRDYLKLAIKQNKEFLIIGNVNALTCRDVFPLFQQEKLWLGQSIRSGDRKFYVPESYPLSAAGCGVDNDGKRYIRVKGVRWYTNMKSDSGFSRLPLSKAYNASDYPVYENYDAIEVSRTKDIPCDYAGLMGVPITFLDHYCPDQFEIVMLANGNARRNTTPALLDEAGYRRHPDDKGGVGIIDGRRAYARVLVRNKNPKRK